MTFYKIENELPQVGSGTKAPPGFKEYTVGNEPKELLNALEKQKEQEEATTKKAEANQYLKDTDWYAARLAETGKEIPQEVRNKREECRRIISS